MGKGTFNFGFSTEYYKFNQHKNCEFFPCHKGVDEQKFNCLFCYCPLYMLGAQCGGNFKYNKGVKDCSGCTVTHGEGAYEHVMSKMKLVSNLAGERRSRDPKV